MRNKPVIINHKDKITEDDKVGEVFNVWFNPDDGWYWCDGVITDVTAQNLIQDKGWSVSCSYDFTSYNDEGGTENNIPYDIEFLDGEFTHLALVNNPRYERANIVFNSKGVTNMNVQNKDDNEKGKWITVKGTHIFIPDGSNQEEVVQKFFDKQKGEGSEKKQSKETNSTRDFKNHLGRIEKLIKKYNLEPHQEEELLDELGSFEAKLDEGLEPREEEELREELFDFEEDIKRHHEMEKEEGKSKEDKDADAYREQRAKERDKKYKNDKVQSFLNKAGDNWVADRDKVKELASILDVDYWDMDSDVIDDILEYSQDDYQYFRNHTDEENRDYEIKQTAEKFKKYAEELKQKSEGKKQDLLKHDLKSMLKEISPSAEYRYDADEKELQVRYLGKWEGDDGSGDYDWQKPTQETKDKIQEIKEKFKKRFGYELKADWGEKNWYSFWIPENKKADNSKETDMALIEELKKLITKVENDKGDNMINNEKEDKRKLIDEVGGILKGKVDDEVIRTIIKKMEEASYNESEAGKADNEKDEDDEKEEVENKKVKNEDVEDKDKVAELKEDEKEEVENKCKNSISNAKGGFFEKMNEIYNSSKSMDKPCDYVSREAKIKAAEDYFA